MHIEAELTQFHLHLDEHPADWSSRLILADWYQDHQMPQSEAIQRWLVEHKRVPFKGRSSDSYWWFFKIREADAVTEGRWGAYDPSEILSACLLDVLTPRQKARMTANLYDRLRRSLEANLWRVLFGQKMTFGDREMF